MKKALILSALTKSTSRQYPLDDWAITPCGVANDSRNEAGTRATAPLVPIPESFSEAQAETILAINRISAIDWGFAQQLLQAWTPECFTGAQAQCIHELLKLDAEDMRATLADAMEPCDLRQRLRSRRTGASAAGLTHGRPSSAASTSVS